jgi:hypothetical protein
MLVGTHFLVEAGHGALRRDPDVVRKVACDRLTNANSDVSAWQLSCEMVERDTKLIDAKKLVEKSRTATFAAPVPVGSSTERRPQAQRMVSPLAAIAPSALDDQRGASSSQ